MNMMPAHKQRLVMVGNGMAGMRTIEELLARAEAVLGMIAAGKLKLRAEHVYKLEDAAQAHRDLEGRKTTGKLLLIP